MNASDGSTGAHAQLPFVAPCRKLRAGAPLGWIRKGCDDLRRAPLQSLSYGALVSIAGALIASYALAPGTRLGGYWFLIAIGTGFVFVAPMLASGTYAISQSLERGRMPSIAGSFLTGLRQLSDELVFGLMLIVVFLVWARAASMVHVFFPATGTPGLADLVPFLAIGSAVGSIFALIIFAASAFSLPMLMDRETDAITAVVTSINAVLRNKRAMCVWIALIIAAVAIGFATLLLGFVVVLPLLGHATWHAYRETIDASDWPQRDRGPAAYG
jgi:uncharacterized membrane protein